MNENDFISKRTGKLVWESKGAYYRFEPLKLPFKINENSELSVQAQKTMESLARLDGFTLNFTKEELLLFQTPFMIKEAQLSSKLEGTRSTLSDVLKEESIEELDPEIKLDNEEIRNYKKALVWAVENMPEKFSEEFIKKIHRKLLEGVRGSNKNPGEYKKYQNAIGKKKDTFETAKFIPASPETTHYLMKNLIDYMNREDPFKLYKIGLTHYQFEAIHPFTDGNGRLGRMLIVIQLFKEKILNQPLLYISEFFTENREEYIKLLYNVSSKGHIEEWLKFFLKALEVQAKKSLELLKKISNYKKELHENADKFSSNIHIHEFLDSLFKQPYFTVKDVQEIFKITQPAARSQIQKLINQKIVVEVKTEKRKKVYVAHKILRILEE